VPIEEEEEVLDALEVLQFPTLNWSAIVSLE
jgi:hypothetical protein